MYSLTAAIALSFLIFISAFDIDIKFSFFMNFRGKAVSAYERDFLRNRKNS